MEKNKNEKGEIILPDLKHDTMEFSAPSDGDDLLDIEEDEEITANELESLNQQEEDEAYALEAVSVDSQADEDNFLLQPEEDEFEEDNEDDLDI